MEDTLVTISDNCKLGPGVATTRRRVGETCPLDCPFLPIMDKLKRRPKVNQPGKCYLAGWRMALSEQHIRGSMDLSKIDGAALVRHVTGGDWLKPTRDGRRIVDREYCDGVFNWHRQPSQRYTIGWGYSHAPERLQKAGYGPENQPDGLKILASCHKASHAKALQDDGWTTARVIDSPSDRERGETLCPYDLAKHRKQKPGVTCASCRLCLPGANKNIAFIKF